MKLRNCTPAILKARFRRWCYLIFRGMSRGEVTVDTYTKGGLLVMLSTGDGDYMTRRTFWMRKK